MRRALREGHRPSARQYVEAHSNLGLALKALGRLEEARQHYGTALALRPDYAAAHVNLGNVLVALGQVTEAVPHYRKAAAIRPDDPEAHVQLSLALAGLLRYDEAVAPGERAVALKPADRTMLDHLGAVFAALGQRSKAVALYEKAMALDPGVVAIRLGYAKALQAAGRIDEALAHLRATVAQHPDDAEAHHNLIAVLIWWGRSQEAIDTIETAAAACPRKPAFFRLLTQIKRIAPDDPLLAAAEALAAESQSLAADDRIQLHFALGHAFGQLGRHQPAMAELLRANALKRQQFTYDEAAMLRVFARAREIFTPELMRAKAGLGDPSDVPVFVIGMPRSGTTLIEQIPREPPGGARRRRAFRLRERGEASSRRKPLSGLRAEPRGGEPPRARRALSGDAAPGSARRVPDRR